MTPEPSRERRDNLPTRDSDVPFKNYVDARIEPVIDRMRTGDVTLREYVEALLEEIHRAIRVADAEREKSAAARHGALERSIDEGDNALRAHVSTQVEQIHTALVAADALERERYAALAATVESLRRESEMRLDAMRRELGLITSAAATAIEKAERSNEKRFESVNEFRSQLGEQTASFLPREVADAQFAELRTRIAEVAEKVSKLVS